MTLLSFSCFPKVSAVDRDAGENGRVQYNLTSDSFVIDSSSGIIKSTKELDHELKPSYVLLVTAMDNGNPRKVGVLG